MQGLRSDIAIVGEDEWKPDDNVSAPGGCFNLRQGSLIDCLANGASVAHLYVFCTNPGSDASYARLKNAVKDLDGVKLFVLPTHNGKSIGRVNDLEISDDLVRPLDDEEIRVMAKRAINRRVEQSWAALDPASQAALKTGLARFEDCFARVQRGEPLAMEEVQLSCRRVRESAQIGTLGGWIDALDDHHNYF